MNLGGINSNIFHLIVEKFIHSILRLEVVLMIYNQTIVGGWSEKDILTILVVGIIVSKIFINKVCVAHQYGYPEALYNGSMSSG